MGNDDLALQREALIRFYFLHSQHYTKVGIKVHAFTTVGTSLIQTLRIKDERFAVLEDEQTFLKAQFFLPVHL